MQCRRNFFRKLASPRMGTGLAHHPHKLCEKESIWQQEHQSKRKIHNRDIDMYTQYLVSNSCGLHCIWQRIPPEKSRKWGRSDAMTASCFKMIRIMQLCRMVNDDWMLVSLCTVLCTTSAYSFAKRNADSLSTESRYLQP